MQVIGFTGSVEIKIRILPTVFFSFIKYQPRVNKTGNNEGKPYVAYKCMTKDINKILEKSFKFFIVLKNIQLF